jgi:hypothetical protein
MSHLGRDGKQGPYYTSMKTHCLEAELMKLITDSDI